jgi:hypothetical protein
MVKNKYDKKKKAVNKDRMKEGKEEIVLCDKTKVNILINC